MSGPIQPHNCDHCPQSASVTTRLDALNANVAGLRVFLQGGIDDEGTYREGLKQEHDRVKSDVAQLIAAANSGHGKRWELVKLGLGIVGGAIAGHFTSRQ